MKTLCMIYLGLSCFQMFSTSTRRTTNPFMVAELGSELSSWKSAGLLVTGCPELVSVHHVESARCR